MALSETGQLAFLALIGHADDEGRLETDADHLHLIALRRSEPAAIEDQLTLMEGRGMIQRYEASGRPIIQLLNWTSHQKVDHPKASTLPAPPSSNPPTPSRRRATRRESSRSVETPPVATRDDATVPEESRDDANALESSRAFDPSRAPADRIGPDPTGRDRTGEESPPTPPPGGRRAVALLTGEYADDYAAFLAELSRSVGRPCSPDSRSRLAYLERRQEGLSADDLLAAARGVALSPHHMGQNDKGLPMNGPVTVLNSSMLDVLTGLGRGDIVPQPTLPRSVQEAVGYDQAWAKHAEQLRREGM